jgi:hypothetical protein
MSRLSLCLCLCALALARPAVAAADLVEPSTGIAFPAEQRGPQGTVFTCLGTGLRKVFLFKVYAITFCVDNPAAALAGIPPAEAGQSVDDRAERLAQDDAFFDRLLQSETDKAVILRMVRDVSREKNADALRKSLGSVLPAPKVELLINTFPGEAKEGQETRIFSSNQRTVTISMGGATKTLEDPEIAAKLWRVWLGPDSVTPKLKESVARRAVLGG